ncbi:MAG: FAD-binding protein, partial [Usitatibacter sp.]
MSTNPSLQALLNTGLRGTLRYDEPMAKHVSWRAGGHARRFYQPADVADLCVFLGNLDPLEPILFLGLGSNLLVRDGGFHGTVVFTHHALTGIAEIGVGVDLSAASRPAGEKSTPTPISRPTFKAGAGVPSPHLARYAAKHGGGGGEWLAGVPGTLGGALAMNAGCYGGETWEHVIAVETVDRTGTLRLRTPTDYDVGYRHVELKGGGEEWFVSGVFVFARGDEAASMKR